MYRIIGCFLRSIVALSLLLGLGGCAERRVDVSGRITYNGSPLDQPGGQIVFVGPHGTQVAADIDADGNYLASQVVVGANRVAVYYKNPAFKPRRFPPKRDEKPEPTVAPLLTPPKYASVETSEFAAEIKEGATFDADLEGPEIERLASPANR